MHYRTVVTSSDELVTGDGTAPRVVAVPIELSKLG